MTPAQQSFLLRQRVARLATVDGEGQPHVLPICFALCGGHLYSPIDQKPKRVAPANLRRLRDIAANGAVCIVVDEYDEDWRALAWLQLRGQAALVADPTERMAAIYALRSRYPQYQAMRLEERPLIRVAISRVVGWRVLG